VPDPALGASQDLSLARRPCLCWAVRTLSGKRAGSACAYDADGPMRSLGLIRLHFRSVITRVWRHRSTGDNLWWQWMVARYAAFPNMVFGGAKESPDGQPLLGPTWEEFLPYSLSGDKKEDFLPGPAQCKPWVPLPSCYRIEAQATFGGKGSTDLGPTAAITLEVVSL